MLWLGGRFRAGNLRVREWREMWEGDAAYEGEERGFSSAAGTDEEEGGEGGGGWGAADYEVEE